MGEHPDLVVPRRQRHGEFQQEAVELRFGQRVGAFVLDRVLGGDDRERYRQPPRCSVDADLVFLHRLQERGLSLGRRPVDFVGKQQVGEHRPFPEGEPGCADVVDERSGDVSRHQIGGELQPLGLQGQRRGECPDQQGLGNPRDALEQRVPAAEQCHDKAADRGILADDSLAHLLAQRDQRLAGRFGFIRCTPMRGGFGRRRAGIQVRFGRHG